MKTLGLIPARGGSVGIPLKNIALCAGRPLIHWTIEAATDSRLDSVFVSTDSREIITAARPVPSIPRPPELATSTAPMVPVVLDALRRLPGFDVMVLLQPTSPLRTSEEINAALDLIEQGADSVVSVHESYAVPFTGEDVPRRQDRQPTLMLNGAIYAVRVPWFLREKKLVALCSVPLIIPAEHAIDIDYPSELALAGLLIGTTRSVNQAVTPDE